MHRRPTSAVAGAHGRNAEEFVYRVEEAGEQPMDVLISATSLSAESLGLGTQIGAIAPGMDAVSSPRSATCWTTSPPSGASGSS